MLQRSQSLVVKLLPLALGAFYFHCTPGSSALKPSITQDPITEIKELQAVEKTVKNCSESTPVSDICEIDPTRLHPTQFSLGMRDVSRKIEKITSLKGSPDDLSKYLVARPGKAVKAPDELFYLVDGHHLARALIEADVKTMRLQVISDYSSLTMSDFWERMQEQKNVWLYDADGHGPQNPLHLPDSVKELVDDPYRSLAEDAQDAGAFEKTDALFQQFYWANFYRMVIPKDHLQSDYDGAVSEAVKISSTPAAKDLPGFKSP